MKLHSYISFFFFLMHIDIFNGLMKNSVANKKNAIQVGLLEGEKCSVL
uniref:Uncharacterized protein n=1 Tax=Anguilla anguilla TaxID=7936 RepID=A0A0E9X621_ANGAN